MAKVLPPIHQKNAPALSQTLSYRYQNGRIVAQKWPVKRGRPKSELTRNQNYLFGIANKMAKAASGYDYVMANLLVKQQPWYPRDMIVSAIYGRLFDTIITTEGPIFSMAASLDITEDLNMLGPSPQGSILIKDETLWKPLQPGNVDDTLSLKIVNGRLAPTWGPSGGGGGAGGVGVLSRVNAPANFSGSSGSYINAKWANEVYDDLGGFDLGANNEVFTVPASLDGTRVRIYFGVYGYNYNAQFQARIVTSAHGVVAGFTNDNQNGVIRTQINSPPVTVSEGDTLYVNFKQNDASWVPDNVQCYFEVEGYPS